MRYLLTLALGIALGLLGGWLLLPWLAAPATVPVVVARIELTPGELSDLDGQLMVFHCPRQLRPPGSFFSLEQLRGKRLRAPVKRGELVLTRDVERVRETVPHFADNIPIGVRAFSVRVHQSDVPPPGTRVDVIAIGNDRSLSIVVEDAEVLATNQNPGQEEPSDYQYVTLVAPLMDAIRLGERMSDLGYFILAIRNPKDQKTGLR